MIRVVGGIAAGAVAMMVAPSFISFVAGAFKPIAKTLIKGGLLAFESGKQAVHAAGATLASSVESIEDLTAEARAEIAGGQKQTVKTAKKK